VGTGKSVAALDAHGKDVTAVAFTADGRTLLTGSLDRTAKLWDVAQRKEKSTLPGTSVGILAIAPSPDGKHVVAGGENRIVYLWKIDQ
jgi:WD40 repeat protein